MFQEIQRNLSQSNPEIVNAGVLTHGKTRQYAMIIISKEMHERFYHPIYRASQPTL